MSRTERCLVGLTVLTVALVGVNGVAEAGQPKAVAIGDSFIAGNAARWHGNSTAPAPGHNGTDRGAGVYQDLTCYRSDVAEINSAELAGLDPVNLACSGATTSSVMSSQLPRLTDLLDQGHRVDLIVVLIGGNNLGFTGIVTSCLFAYVGDGMGTQGTPCNEAQQRALTERLPAMREGVEAVIREIQRIMEGQPPFRLIVQTYPSPVPAASDTRYPQGNGTQTDPRVGEGGCPLYDVDLDWARRQAIPQIAAALRAAAESTGAEFLDNQNALDGREVCSRHTSLVGAEGPSPLTADWVRWANLFHAQGDFSALVHPNAYAQRAFGSCLALVWAQEPGNYACRNTPGTDHTGMYLDAPPADPPPPGGPVPGPPAADTAAPDTRITAGPKPRTRRHLASFEFSSTEPGSTLDCALDDGGFRPCTSPLRLRVDRGRHTFKVRATDAAGNTDPTPAVVEWKVKRRKPGT